VSSKTHYKTLVESDWLGQWDLGAKSAVVVIESVIRFVPLQKLRKKDPRTGDMRDEQITRLDVGFVGKRKHWLAGSTSQKTLKSLFGPYVEDWIGKQIELYVDPSVMFGRERTGGIRVRPAIPRGEPTADLLDNPVDVEASSRIDVARDLVTPGREPGEEG
jgi:hypothetical protein